MKNAEATIAENTPAVAEQGATVAPEKPASKKTGTPKKSAPKAKKGAQKAAPKKGAKPAAKKAAKAQPAKEASVPREFSKKAIVLELLRRPKGATLAELMEATKWQAHSVRGFISGTLGKKMDLPVASAQREDGTRFYSLAK